MPVQVLSPNAALTGEPAGGSNRCLSRYNPVLLQETRICLDYNIYNLLLVCTSNIWYFWPYILNTHSVALLSIL